ncbi:MAG: hypothetical protein RLZZ563_2334, partial [Pseudomonadota bacterium]
TEAPAPVPAAVAVAAAPEPEPEDDSGEGYGYGWSISNDGDSDYAAHTGSWMGTSTLYQRNLTTGVTVILLANGEAADLWDLAAEIEETLD